MQMTTGINKLFRGMWLTDEAPTMGFLQQDNHFKVTWQGHSGKNNWLFRRQVHMQIQPESRSVPLLPSLASVQVAAQFDFCLREVISGHSYQQLPWHIQAMQY